MRDWRRFISGVTVGLLAAPLAAAAQAPGRVRIGWLAPVTQDQARGFREALRARGYVDGQTVVQLSSRQLDRRARVVQEHGRGW